MEENGWTRAGRLWTLLEWSFIGSGLILTLIWVSVTGLRNYITSPSADRKLLKHKRVLVLRQLKLKTRIANGHSELGKALAHKLRTDHECHVITSLCPRAATSGDIICDLTNNLGLHTQLQELWEQVNGIDLVVCCEAAQGQSTGSDVGQTVERIGSNIQRMINLLIHLVPKMIERGSGKFVIVREDFCPPNRRDETECCEYDELLGQLLSASTRRSSIGLIKLYCPSVGLYQAADMGDTVDRIVDVLESGKMSGIVDLSNKNELWAAVLRKASLGVWPVGVSRKGANNVSKNAVQIK